MKKNTSEIEIILSSVYDRENLVSEIWIDNQMVAELNTENGDLEITLYQHKEICMKYTDLMDGFYAAREKLEGNTGFFTQRPE